MRGLELHLAVDQAGVIVGQALTDATADDARTGGGLLKTVPDAITRRWCRSRAAFDPRPLVSSAATVAQYPGEFEGAPEVHDQIPRWKLARV